MKNHRDLKKFSVPEKHLHQIDNRGWQKGPPTGVDSVKDLRVLELAFITLKRVYSINTKVDRFSGTPGTRPNGTPGNCSQHIKHQSLIYNAKL